MTRKISYPEDYRTIPPALWEKMNMTPEEYGRMRAERLAREAEAPEVGDMAPDFRLELLSPEGEPTGRRVALSEFRGRPCALVFGSYT